ncbi:hypothetical protein ACN20G_12875 [Streptomyces sp. BI20]|uniref:hypothetical protein n=1 Tax=Streptomyces sp. BI20 TaxID=3403460 RepID=UPI003C746656
MRTTVSAVLIALLVLLVPASAVAYWADRELGDADRYTAAMAPLAENPEVRRVVVEQAGRAISAQIDLGPFRAGVESLLEDALRSFTGTPAYRTAWEAANRAAHTAFLNALTRDEPGEEEAVTIDLAPVLASVRQELVADGVPFANRIPVTHLRVKVMEYENLKALREGFRVLRTLGVWLPVLTLVVAVGAVAVAVRRGRAVCAVGLGIALGAGLLAIAVAVCRGLALADLPADVDRPAAEAVYDALTSFLRTTVWWLLALGLVVALGAWLFGRIRRTRGAV